MESFEMTTTCMSPGCRRPAVKQVTRTDRNGVKTKIHKCEICLNYKNAGSFKSASTLRRERMKREWAA